MGGCSGGEGRREVGVQGGQRWWWGAGSTLGSEVRNKGQTDVCKEAGLPGPAPRRIPCLLKVMGCPVSDVRQCCEVGEACSVLSH